MCCTEEQNQQNQWHLPGTEQGFTQMTVRTVNFKRKMGLFSNLTGCFLHDAYIYMSFYNKARAAYKHKHAGKFRKPA